MVASPATSAPAGQVRPVTVGSQGNEPLVRVSPDGRTVYVAALQHLYVSRDGGRSFGEIHDLVVGGPAVYASDSSLDVARDGRLHVAINYPFAGTVAVCSSADQARSFACDPAAVPGVNDRQWLLADRTGGAFLTSNVGLYETTLFTSARPGTPGSFRPTQVTPAELAPVTGGLSAGRAGSLLQPLIDDADDASRAAASGDNKGVELDGPLSVLEWQPSEGALLPVKRPTPLLAGSGVPSLATTPDGTGYLVSEGVSGSRRPGVPAGKDVRVARTRDNGRSWTVLPALPGTTSGTAALSAVAAGGNGEIGVIYYRTSSGGLAGTRDGAWDLVWTRTSDAHTSRPEWRTTVVERGVHRGPICIPDCTDGGRFAGDFISAHIDGSGSAHLVWMRDAPGQPVPGPTQIRYATLR
jgi:hypothetical protein